jgi:hypothetical protein
MNFLNINFGIDYNFISFEKPGTKEGNGAKIVSNISQESLL